MSALDAFFCYDKQDRFFSDEFNFAQIGVCSNQPVMAVQDASDVEGYPVVKGTSVVVKAIAEPICKSQTLHTQRQLPHQSLPVS